MLRDIELLYRQHLTDTDRGLLALGRGTMLDALGSEALEASLFGRGAKEHPDRTPGEPSAGSSAGALVGASPFLTFAVAVHRTASRLERTTFVEESFGRRQRVPVFDVDPLRALLAEPMLRYFLVELLASYTHVSSGATWHRTSRGWRRRRFSELDPVRLAGLLEMVGAAERPGVYRRLGDLALFLTGVFPDARSLFEMGPASLERILRLSGAARRLPEDLPGGPELLEMLGARWYRLAAAAAQATGAPHTDALGAVEAIAQRFPVARRVLNVVTDWYLFPFRDRWFGVSGGS